ncbi:LOW QUALITY PROTEIN: hypothetical protein RJ641_005258 [Dillenia turbinata]|uniref:Uncharacterized protein n=1 Tax=Dillenia turbinata TaxID=194707 RepID=A0AAN8VK00_9MAGN
MIPIVHKSHREHKHVRRLENLGEKLVGCVNKPHLNSTEEKEKKLSIARMSVRITDRVCRVLKNCKGNTLPIKGWEFSQTCFRCFEGSGELTMARMPLSVQWPTEKHKTTGLPLISLTFFNHLTMTKLDIFEYVPFLLMIWIMPTLLISSIKQPIFKHLLRHFPQQLKRVKLSIRTNRQRDPNIHSEFNLPANATTVDGKFFKYSTLHGLEGSSQTFRAVKS